MSERPFLSQDGHERIARQVIEGNPYLVRRCQDQGYLFPLVHAAQCLTDAETSPSLLARRIGQILRGEAMTPPVTTEEQGAEPPDGSTIGAALPGRFTPSHYRIYRQIADGTAGAFMAPSDVRMLLDEIARLEAREAAARADIEGALCGISDDYMTSEKHHPGYVLIPVEKFEQLRVAEAALGSTTPERRRCPGQATRADAEGRR